MSTWFEGACIIIQEAMKDVPEDMPLKDRRKAVNAARPYEYHVASWGKKTWARAARAYLERHGAAQAQIAAGR